MYNNMMFMGRPTKEQYSQFSCGQGCNNLGPTDPIDKIGSRKNRDKVKEQIRTYVLTMLGAPVLELELNEQQIDNATEFALQIFEDYAPMEYFQWWTFNTTPGQSVYTLPPDIGYVRQISYKEIPHSAYSAQDLGGVIPLEYMASGSYGSIAGGMNPQQPIWGKTGEWTLYKQYESMFSRMSSQQGGWEYLGGYNAIKLYPIPSTSVPVAVRYLQRRPDFRLVTQAMQEGTLAFVKIILGRIRSKISNPPGPNGGVQLDGQALLAEGLAEKKEFEQNLLIRWGDVLGPTLG
ncbi:MAG: hypothetical protein WCG45_00915 [bacterium]